MEFVAIKQGLRFSLCRKTIYSRFTASALSKSDTQTLVDDEEEIQIKYDAGESDGTDASQMEKPGTEKSQAMVAECITEEKEEPGFDTCDKLSSLRSLVYANINEENSLSSKDEESLVSDEGVPVLVHQFKKWRK